MLERKQQHSRKNITHIKNFINTNKTWLQNHHQESQKRMQNHKITANKVVLKKQKSFTSNRPEFDAKYIFRPQITRKSSKKITKIKNLGKKIPETWCPRIKFGKQESRKISLNWKEMKKLDVEEKIPRLCINLYSGAENERRDWKKIFILWEIEVDVSAFFCALPVYASLTVSVIFLPVFSVIITT